MIAKRFLDATGGAGGYSSTTALLGFTTAFDKASNKLYERHLHPRIAATCIPPRTRWAASASSVDRLNAVAPYLWLLRGSEKAAAL